MTQDWRKIEAAIADFLDREGLTISNFSDTFADLEPVCAPNGDPGLEEGFGINITKLARELADLK